MSDFRTSDAEGIPASEALLRELDPVLNVFALANGLDLEKDLAHPPSRLLGWYRDGMERFLRLESKAGEDGRFVLWAEASQRRGEVVREGRRPVDDTLSGELLRSGLRTVLERGIEQANALLPSDLEPRGGDPP